MSFYANSETIAAMPEAAIIVMTVQPTIFVIGLFAHVPIIFLLLLMRTIGIKTIGATIPLATAE